MGEPISVVYRQSRDPSFAVFETNRSFTGMGHEQYNALEDVVKDRVVDNLAAKLFNHASVDQVHIYAQAITVKKAAGFDVDKAKKLIEDFYIYYGPGVEVPSVESFS